MPAISNPFDRNTLIHLRLVFSIFLLPVYIFALSQTAQLSVFNCAIIFIILHLFIYPASNLYNTFWDKDVGSIGGIRNPPPATRKLYNASILLDVSGIILGAMVDPLFAFALIPYIAASKLYSWERTRLKKYSVGGWILVITFQGAYTYFLASFFAGDEIRMEWFNEQNILAMIISSFFIGAFYPLTQIYQHEEDLSRGDVTISYRLGIKGTFIFSAILFFITLMICYDYFSTYYYPQQFYLFLVFFIPGILYFIYWFYLSLKDPANASFDHAMRMTIISSSAMILAYATLFVLNH